MVNINVPPLIVTGSCKSTVFSDHSSEVILGIFQITEYKTAYIHIVLGIYWKQNLIRITQSVRLKNAEDLMKL